MSFLNLKKRARRVTLALLAGMALLLGLFVSAPASAAAMTGSCSASGASWHPFGSPAWGQMRWCTAYDYGDDTLYTQFQVQDVLTDGWNVHLEIGATNGGTHWSADNAFGPSGTSVCQSTGSVVTCYVVSWFPTGYVPGSGGYQLLVRLAKGSANGSHPAYGSAWAYFNA